MKRVGVGLLLYLAVATLAHAEPGDKYDMLSFPSGAAQTHQRASWSHGGAIAGRPSRWCGWWMGIHKGLTDRALWVAANWAKVGRPAAGPCVGCIGVEPHHVYEVLAIRGPGRVLAISGNDGHQVQTRERSTGRTFAWRVL